MKRKPTKIMTIVSVIILVIGIVLGLGGWTILMNTVFQSRPINIDGTDFSGVFKLFGSFTSAALGIAIIIRCFFLIAILWVVYGIILLFLKVYQKTTNKKIFLVAGLVTLLGLLSILMFSQVQKSTFAKSDTIGSLAFNFTHTKSTVHIKENGQYVPYLVLHNDYDNTGNSLLLREHLIGGTDGYVTDYNGLITQQKIYIGQMEMGSFDYEKTLVDEYLCGEFPQRIDANLLAKICNTSLNLSIYNDGDYVSKDLERKFFLPSYVELCGSEVFDNKTTNRTKLEYFDSDERRKAVNEAGVAVSYWTRTKCGEFAAIGPGGGFLMNMGNSVKFGIRPALTIPSNTPVKKIYNNKSQKEILIFDL